MNATTIKTGDNLINVLPSGTALAVVAIEDLSDASGSMWRVVPATDCKPGVSHKQLISRNKTYACPVANLRLA